jgi:hypothetical protein
MAETLGSLCDKLTVLILKQWHSQDQTQLSNIEHQEKLLRREIDEYIHSAINGTIPLELISLPANKVYQKKGNQVKKCGGDIGDVFSELALINCKLWHQQEKVYQFETVPIHQKDEVIKQLAVLNLERNQCIDEINSRLYRLVKSLSG